MRLNPEKKMAPGKIIEKKILREAFAPLLPQSVAWRQKEQFSDGVGYSWIDSLKAMASAAVSDEEMRRAAERFPVNPPQNKEEYYYRTLFEEHFPSVSAAKSVPSVPSVACSTAEALAWDESFRQLNDPSGRAVRAVGFGGHFAGNFAFENLHRFGNIQFRFILLCQFPFISGHLFFERMIDFINGGGGEIEVAERYFLQYDSVIFTKTPKYSNQNPIPECKVYEHGTIYRILLGTFNTKRAVSTFRGAYPLSYLVNDEDKWCYYTGGFATREEADSVQVVLKKHGFLRPEVVVWNDGVYRNLDREDETPVAYRVEISGADDLPDAVRQVIAEQAGGRELSRVGQQLFIIGTFDDRAVAEQLVQAIGQADPSLEIKVAEASE